MQDSGCLSGERNIGNKNKIRSEDVGPRRKKRKAGAGGIVVIETQRWLMWSVIWPVVCHVSLM